VSLRTPVTWRLPWLMGLGQADTDRSAWRTPMAGARRGINMAGYRIDDGWYGWCTYQVICQCNFRSIHQLL
jgi:hypothetical protein